MDEMKKIAALRGAIDMTKELIDLEHKKINLLKQMVTALERKYEATKKGNSNV